jgi:PadR family transcriptional regulator, regulatory protein PadR
MGKAGLINRPLQKSRTHLYISRVGSVVPPFRVTDATLDVLEVLLHGGAELYGLKITKAAGRATGSVFPILARLENCGWADSEWEAGDPAARGPRRRFYQLSPDGIVRAGELLAQRRADQARRLPRGAVLRPVQRSVTVHQLERTYPVNQPQVTWL